MQCFHSPPPHNEGNGQLGQPPVKRHSHGRALTGHLNEWGCHRILHFICKQSARPLSQTVFLVQELPILQESWSLGHFDYGG